MTLFCDPSALVRRYVRCPGNDLVRSTMAGDEHWCASAVARAECLQALHALASTPGQRDELWANLRADWAAFWAVPVDDRCLALAVDIGAAYRIRSIDSIHLAAADRLPRPARYLTFDRRQIPAAAGLGLEVIAPTEG